MYSMTVSTPATERTNAHPFPARTGEFTLFNAISVFTHLTEEQAPHYLREAARIVADDGVVHASFFLLDKRELRVYAAARKRPLRELGASLRRRSSSIEAGS